MTMRDFGWITNRPKPLAPITSHSKESEAWSKESPAVLFLPYPDWLVREFRRINLLPSSLDSLSERVKNTSRLFQFNPRKFLKEHPCARFSFKSLILELATSCHVGEPSIQGLRAVPLSRYPTPMYRGGGSFFLSIPGCLPGRTSTRDINEVTKLFVCRSWRRKPLIFLRKLCDNVFTLFGLSGSGLR